MKRRLVRRIFRPMLLVRHVHTIRLGECALAALNRIADALERDPQILQEIFDMGAKTQAAITDLVAEVQDSKTKLEGLTTFVQGIPALVAAAVAEALAQSDLDDQTQADAVAAAKTEISDAVDSAVTAAGTTPAGDPVPDAPDSPPV